MKPVVENSDLVITGTGRPPNAVWRCTEKGSGAWRPSLRRHAEDVEHAVVDPHPEPDDTVLRRRQAGRRARSGPPRSSTGTTVVIGPPSMRAQAGQVGPVGLERVPAEPVEHEQHDRGGAGERGREPRRAVESRLATDSVGMTLVSAAPP